MASLWVPLLVAALQGGPAEIEAGRMAFERCSSCHAAPDPGLPGGKIWLGMVSESA